MSRKTFNIRDSALYIEMKAGTKINVDVVGIWAHEGAEDIVYFQDPFGALERRILSGSNIRTIEFTSHHDGVHRLDVTGYSFREVRVQTQPYSLVFEPAKVHNSLTFYEKNCELFFYVPTDKEFSFNARYEKPFLNDSYQFTLLSPLGQTYTLALENECRYDERHKYGKLLLQGKGTWSVKFNFRGKAAFWLDGQEMCNAFCTEKTAAKNISTLINGHYQHEGRAQISINNEVLSETTVLGTTVMPYVTGMYDRYERIINNNLSNLDFINYYVFLYDHRNTHRKFNSDKVSYIIMDPRRPPQNSPSRSEETFYDNESFARDIEAISDKVGKSIFTSIYDEPNLRFKNKQSHKNEFIKVLTEYKSVSALARTKITFPESSFMINGPFVSENSSRIGLDWTIDLLKDNEFKALLNDDDYNICWHEWMHRDLLRTDYYEDIINRTYNEIRNWAHNFKLNISQTNICSGNASSHYESDSFYSAVWLASAFSHSAQTGKLHTFSWFPLFDELELYQKGAIEAMTHIQPGRYKAAYYALKFILDNKMPYTLKVEYNRGDLAVLAMKDTGTVGLFVTNKSLRSYQLDIQCAFGKFQQIQMTTLNTENPVDPAINRMNGAENMNVTLEPFSINFLKFTM